MAKVDCSKCGWSKEVPDDLVGLNIHCGKCEADITVPQPTPRSMSSDDRTFTVAISPRGSSLGIGGLVLGVLALPLCFIPFICMIAVPLSAFGLLLAAIGFIVALIRKGAGVGYPLAGAAVSAVALTISVAMTQATGKAINVLSGGDTSPGQETVHPSGERGIAQGGEREPRADAHAERSIVWTPADRSAQRRDVEIRIVSCRVGQVTLTRGSATLDETLGTSQSVEAILAVTVEITNSSDTRKVEYLSWRGREVIFARDYASICDNFGNKYRRVGFGLVDRPAGSVSMESVYPGKSIRDVLAFEKPLKTVEFLSLEMPAENFGGAGMVRFRVPARMIEWSAAERGSQDTSRETEVSF